MDPLQVNKGMSNRVNTTTQSSMRGKAVDALKRAVLPEKPTKEPALPKESDRNIAYAKAMKGAYDNAEDKGTLGKGFGGEAPKSKPFPAPSVLKVGKRIVK